MTSKMKEATLIEVCDFIGGLWTGKKPPYVNVSVLRNTNFQKNGELNYDDIAFINVEEKQFSKRELQFGDIILEKSGGGPKQPVGRVCIFENTEKNYSFSNFTAAIRIKNPKELHYRYLHWYLHHLYQTGVTQIIQTNSTGIRNLQMDEYKKIIIPIPLMEKQLEIVKKISLFAVESQNLEDIYIRRIAVNSEMNKAFISRMYQL